MTSSGPALALKEQGATSYVLDVRDNPGGLLDMAFAVSNLFLKKGQMVVYTKGRYKRDESSYITETDSPWSNVPLVVMTSRHWRRRQKSWPAPFRTTDHCGLIVGERTFGKGLVRPIWAVRSVRGYALSLTTARYYTPFRPLDPARVRRRHRARGLSGAQGTQRLRGRGFRGSAARRRPAAACSVATASPPIRALSRSRRVRWWQTSSRARPS